MILGIIASSQPSGDYYGLDNFTYTSKSLDVSAQGTDSSNSMRHLNDILYIQVGSTIYEYTLTTEDIDDATYASNSFATTSVYSGINIKSDGTKFIGTNLYSDTALQDRTFGTNYDVSTIGARSFGSVTTNSGAWREGIVTPDGTGIFCVDSGNKKVYYYPLSTAWDGTSQGDTTYNYDLSNEFSGTDAYAMAISPDGKTMLVFRDDQAKIYDYTLPSEWSLNGTVTAEGSELVSSQFTNNCNAMCYSQGGTMLFVMDASTQIIYQYSL